MDTLLNNKLIYSIIEFQYRILDMAFLPSTSVIDKINFIKIIKSNLMEFISGRMNSIKSQNEIAVIIGMIEDLFQTLGAIIEDINEDNKVKLPAFSKSFEILQSKIPSIYSGENDFEYIPSINSDFYSVLSSDVYNKYDENTLFIINTPIEIINIDKIIEIYKSKFNVNKKNKTKYSYIDDYYEFIKNNDMIIRNPYQSYQHVLDFIDQMCTNPNIKIIMISLYRTAINSKIINSLIKAKTLNKKVFVYIESRANGDEENNIENIEKLRSHGIIVRTNYHGYKVHAKVFLAVDKDGYKFAHIGTGNYNEDTGKLYTDIQYITSDINITDELTNIMISLFKKKFYSQNEPNNISSSPLDLRKKITDLIDDEIKKGKNGRIFIKCNNLCDTQIINKLYFAASKGVDVKIIVRTGCIAYPKYNNLQIRSKVGKYLEHDRFYIFGNRAFISSADIYTRNLSNRLEIMCEINQTYKFTNLFYNIWYSCGIHLMTNDSSWTLA